MMLTVLAMRAVSLTVHTEIWGAVTVVIQKMLELLAEVALHAYTHYEIRICQIFSITLSGVQICTPTL